MPFDSTVSGSSANSYLGVEEADDMMDGFDKADKWDELDTTDKEQMLIEATRIIDSYPEGGWGKRKDDSQRLAFPRELDADGIIPEEVRMAVCEYLNYKLEGSRIGLKKLQSEGVTSTSLLGMSSTMQVDRSELPSGCRRLLDRLINSHWPNPVTNLDYDGTNTPDALFP